LSRADTNAEAVDDTTDDEHGNAVRGGHEDGTNDPNQQCQRVKAGANRKTGSISPDDGADHNGLFTTEYVREISGNEGSQP